MESKVCPECSGRGYKSQADRKAGILCDECQGTGVVYDLD